MSSNPSVGEARTAPAGAAGVCLDGLDGRELAAVARAALARMGQDAVGDAVRECARGLADGHLMVLAADTVGSLGRNPLAVGSVDDEALARSITDLERLGRMVHGEKLRRIAEFDQRKAHQGRARSTADWLVGKLGVTPGQAKSHADAAAALQRLPETSRRLRDGELGIGQAHQAARSLGELDQAADDGHADEQATRRLDGHVAMAGRLQNPAQLRRSIDQLHHEHEPDVLAERQRRAHARRDAWINTGPEGEVRFGGNLDAVAGAQLSAAINALARPGKGEERTAGQRRADAFTELARRQLDGGDLPEVAAAHPHIILITTEHGLAGTPGADASWLDGYGPVSSETARLVACQGEVTEVVVDAYGRPLKVVEDSRPTRRQRRAVLARDRACIGCGAPASRCQIHHVVWRRNKGATVVDNLVLVCPNCHHCIHHDGWTVQRREGVFSIRRPDADAGACTGTATHPPPHGGDPPPGFDLRDTA